ncbi:MAG: TerC/Alx family metal homeostasis membrane protein [Bacteroidota bacterium]|nr:TerC/Alx family metal homeostasis membrane protein [Bacteroidota bacterium]
MSTSEIIFFSSFIVFILLILFIDLGLFSKRYRVVSFKESLFWTGIWVSLSLAFYVFLRFKGHWVHDASGIDQIQILINKFQHPIDIGGLGFSEAIKVYNNNLALEYLTGYIIEYALSIDNVFVMILIFMSFGVDERYYKKVLFWGILGAIILRFIFIFLSATLIMHFHWVLYVFGGFLIATAIRMFYESLKGKREEIDPKKHPVVRFFSRNFRVYPSYVRHKFFITRDHKTYITPLFIVLMVIEFSDVIFAVDSVPAIFSVTKDPYIVFFSNVFAIIGLRSLFFLISNMMSRFHYLKFGLSVLLGFVGFKMMMPLFTDFNISTRDSLLIIVGILTVSALASIFVKRDQ